MTRCEPTWTLVPGVKVPGGAFGAGMVGGRDPGALAEYAAAMTGSLRVRGKVAVWLQTSRGVGHGDAS